MGSKQGDKYYFVKYTYMRKNNKITDQLFVSKVLDLYVNQKYHTAQICKELNVSPNSLTKIFKSNSIDTKNRINFFDEHVFEKIDVPQKAYWLGFIYADGCVQMKKYRFKLNLSFKDRIILEKFIKFMSCKDIIKDYEYRGRKNSIVSLNSKTLCSSLVANGVFENKSKILLFPHHLIDEELIRHFIVGYLDGDGWISIDKYMKPRISIGLLGTWDMLNNIQMFLIQQLDFNEYKIAPKSNVYQIIWKGQTAMKILDYLYQGNIDSLERKKQKYIDFKQSIEENK